jgi:hypothetical protein
MHYIHETYLTRCCSLGSKFHFLLLPLRHRLRTVQSQRRIPHPPTEPGADSGCASAPCHILPLANHNAVFRLKVTPEWQSGELLGEPAMSGCGPASGPLLFEVV